VERRKAAMTRQGSIDGVGESKKNGKIENGDGRAL
jgi:hypothetical protein